MNYMAIKKVDIADGIGVRVGLYVAGCHRHCEGCHNSDAWPFDSGNPFDDRAKTELMDILRHPWIEGISILGGEPLDPENRDEVFELIFNILQIFEDTKTIWVYTGYTWEEVLHLPAMWMIDVLVDGPFIADQRDLSLRFRGSRNQRIINVSASLMDGQIHLWQDELWDPIMKRNSIGRDLP